MRDLKEMQMKLLRFSLIMFVGLMPLSASDAIVQVEFAAGITESFDIGGDDITGLYTTMEGVFYIDTTAPVSSIGNYPGAVFGTETHRDGVPLLFQGDFTCGGSCANDVFVGTTQEANIYVQDFFVGNLNLILMPAGGVNFNNDIGVFSLAAQGNVTDYFDIFDSQGSVQVDGEDFFQLYDLTLTEISQVPVPAAVWLFGSALLGLTRVVKRDRV